MIKEENTTDCKSNEEVKSEELENNNDSDVVQGAPPKVPPKNFAKVMGGRVEYGTKVLDSLLKGSKQDIINLINGDGVDPISMIKTVVLTGVNCIPYIGGILSTLMDIIWSAFGSSKQDISKKFKEFIDREVEEKIEKYDLDSLKSRYQGLCNIVSIHYQKVQIWLDEKGDESSTSSLRNSFESIDNSFTLFIEDAKKEGYEISELVFFALIATSHIALMSEFVIYGRSLKYDGPQIDYHKKRLTNLIDSYTKHCAKFYRKGFNDILGKLEGDAKEMLYEVNNYNRLLKYESYLKNNVFDFVNMWWSIDPRNLPRGGSQDNVRYLFSRICGDVNSKQPIYNYPQQEEFLHASIGDITLFMNSKDMHRYRGEFAGLNAWCGDRVNSIQSTARRTLKPGNKSMEIEIGERVGDQTGGFLVKSKNYTSVKPLESFWVGSQIVPFNMNIDGVTFGNHDGRATQYKLGFDGHKVGYIYGFGNCQTNGFNYQVDALVAAFIPKGLKWKGYIEMVENSTIPIDAQLYNESNGCDLYMMNENTLNTIKLQKGKFITYNLKYKGDGGILVKVRPRGTSGGLKTDKCTIGIEYYCNGNKYNANYSNYYRLYHSSVQTSTSLHTVRYDFENEYFALPSGALITLKFTANGDCDAILSHIVVIPICKTNTGLREGRGTNLDYNFYFDVNTEDADKDMEMDDEFYDDVDDVDKEDLRRHHHHVKNGVHHRITKMDIGMIADPDREDEEEDDEQEAQKVEM